MGGPGPGLMPAPPPELLRFKKWLYALATGYAAVLVLGLVAGQLSNALSYVLVLVAALFMVMQPERCMGQCLLPFALWTIMNVFLDFFNVMAVLFRPFPSAGQLFSDTCVQNRSARIDNTTTAVYKNPDFTERIYLSNNTVFWQHNFCDWQWVLGNITMFIGFGMDIVAASVGWRMLKTLMSLAGNDGGNPLLGMGGPSGFGPGPGLGPGPGGGGGGGGGGPMGGGGGGGMQGAEMGAGRTFNARQQQQQASGFQPFQGSGQTLNSA